MSSFGFPTLMESVAESEGVEPERHILSRSLRARVGMFEQKPQAGTGSEGLWSPRDKVRGTVGSIGTTSIPLVTPTSPQHNVQKSINSCHRA